MDDQVVLAGDLGDLVDDQEVLAGDQEDLVDDQVVHVEGHDVGHCEEDDGPYDWDDSYDVELLDDPEGSLGVPNCLDDLPVDFPEPLPHEALEACCVEGHQNHLDV